MEKHKMLFFDLETAPTLAYVWSPAEGYVNAERMIKDFFILSWAAKWADGTKILGDVLTGREARAQSDGRIVRNLAKLVREADVVVAHNINKFDIPKLNTRAMLLGQAPLGPVRTIDTLILARQNHALAYNNLNYLARVLGLGEKVKTDFKLWAECYHGDEKALAKMHVYNKHDVTLLEAVYGGIRPTVRNLPRLVDGGSGCPSCGSALLTKRGFYRTNASTFQRYQCSDCARYSRARKADKTRGNSDYHPL